MPVTLSPSGSPAMIRSGVDSLARVDIPSQRMWHDSIEEPVAAMPGRGTSV
ncbi:hypothetical protein [Streptomyces sp. NPDC050564]|uniref:hypothetical protein n=1 Tax=Streptomyces sp. NPDC050564 TaxID=3365631 RepID=UPI0037A84E22